MNGWVSSQGLLFQLTHAGSVQEGKSAFLGGLMRLVLRLILLLMLLAVVFWIFMAKRVQFGWFRDQLGERISLATGADSPEEASKAFKSLFQSLSNPQFRMSQFNVKA
jgi:hypothetical protein